MHDIRNVIFDFGNVLFDLDLPAIGRNFDRLLGPGQAEIARKRLEEKGILQLFETGGMSTPEFVDALRNLARPPLREDQVLEAWNSVFIDMPRERFDMLIDLRRRFNVFLLSNINALHEAWIAEYMERVHRIRDFEARYFDGVYYSHLIRLRKPDRDVYEYLLADAELEPGQCVFFDDVEENVAAACAAGIHGIHKPAGEDILPVVRKMLFPESS